MTEFIIWLIGAILTLKAVFEIIAQRGIFWKKLIFIVLLLATSWIGLLLYYFVVRNYMPRWLN